MAKAGKSNMGVFALEFIASLVYIYVIFAGLGPSAAVPNSGNPLASIIWSVAAISAIGLFIGSFAGLSWGWSTAMMDMVKKAVMMGGLAMVALAAGVGGFFYNGMLVWALIGYVLGTLGLMIA